MGYIYKITNQINGKMYIGKTEKTIEERWKQHIKKAQQFTNRYLYDAMNHYGYDNFIIEVVEECDNKLLDEKEIYYINFFDTYNNGYNMTLGGDGGNTWIKNNHKEETSKKISAAHKGKKRSPEACKHIREAQKGSYDITINKDDLYSDIMNFMSIEDMCKKYNCSRRTFYLRCQDYFHCTPTQLRGDRLTHTNTAKKIIDKDLLLQKIKEQLTLKEISEYFEVSTETIRRRIEEYFHKNITELRND